MGEDALTTIPIPRQIARTPAWKVITRESSKKWKAVNSKRRRVDVARTVPHGFNAWGDVEEEDQELMENLDLLMDS